MKPLANVVDIYYICLRVAHNLALNKHKRDLNN